MSCLLSIPEFLDRQEFITEDFKAIKQPYCIFDKDGVDWLVDVKNLPPDILNIMADEMFEVC